MRSFPAVTLTLAIARSVVIASPAVLHDHRHAHAVKRALVVTKIVDVPGPTVIAYELNGKLVDRQKVCKGIEEGTLLWADGNNVDHGCSSSSTAAVAQPTPTTSITEPLHSAPAVAIEHKEAVTASKVALSHTSEPARSAVAFDSTSISSSATSSSSASTALLKSSPSSATSSSTSASTFALSAAAPYNSEAASTTSSSTPGGKGLDSEFPDGIIDCSTFPSDYGPIEVEWANLGGWSGIQYITVEGDSVTDIVTAVPGGKGCIPGAMCSYACPPGYQKSQWPSTQGATGQSVGGIHCNSNGKLALTNPSLSKYLCIEGTGATTVQNKLSTNVAICRTDYPGL